MEIYAEVSYNRKPQAFRQYVEMCGSKSKAMAQSIMDTDVMKISENIVENSEKIV